MQNVNHFHDFLEFKANIDLLFILNLNRVNKNNGVKNM